MRSQEQKIFILVLNRDESDAPCAQKLERDTGKIRTGKMIFIHQPMAERQLRLLAESAFRDPLLDEIHIGQIPLLPGYRSQIAVSKRPGVTDDEGMSAQKVLMDLYPGGDYPDRQFVFTKDLYLFENPLKPEMLFRIGSGLLGNPLIHEFQMDFEKIQCPPGQVSLHADLSCEEIDLALDHAGLLNLSRDRLLSLNLEELLAIRDYYKTRKDQGFRKELGLSEHPTDLELEVLAQSWSEHCKHKEFNALIEFHEEGGKTRTVDSLFKTFIQGSTHVIQKQLEERGEDWLIKVFSDNAGIVRVNSQYYFTWKVETHNSPSALDPYGGAITGILGVNRDSFATGIGGARVLFNTDVLCFGPPDYSRPLLKGQLHPRRVLEGVCKGIESGGNKMGIPTVHGAILFDDRFSGKPLVFCGSASLMPASFQGRPSDVKKANPGDLIIMSGGRVGKDGIHGATFSSAEIHDSSPQSAVQIGSPFTQKMLFDFLEEATKRGLIRAMTDNGAGGLSSSVGEMALLTGGARVDVEKIPLKYPGLKSWEIFVSESQERMTLIVDPAHWDALNELSRLYEVESTRIGEFTADGYLHLVSGKKHLALLHLDFIDDGVPRKKLTARWKKPELREPEIEVKSYSDTLLRLLSSWNICSRESVIRQYDHEVKGQGIIKPLMGKTGCAPQDAAVIRVDHESWEGIAVSCGICPRYGDLDPYEMSLGAFDEAVRQIISVGGRLPGPQGDGFWSVNDNFCLPDVVFHEKTNPDGEEKLGKLVRMCQALYDYSTCFGIPMTSGKDSMKNDFSSEGTKISAPPTVLYSATAKIRDVRNCITSDFKFAGDLIYLLGETYDELGGSEFYALDKKLGKNVPRVHLNRAKELYQKYSQAHAQGLIRSSHDLSDGGLAVTLAECAMGGVLGADLKIPEDELSLNAWLFSESHSRLLITIAPEHQQKLEEIMGNRATHLGLVREDPWLRIHRKDKRILELGLETATRAWRGALHV